MSKLLNESKNATRVLISMPDDFLKKTDDVAKYEGRTRSELIRQAIREYVRGFSNVR